jgi:CRP-like cAMP-binding protein
MLKLVKMQEPRMQWVSEILGRHPRRTKAKGECRMKRMEFKQGRVIFGQGDRSDLCYKIERGSVAIRMASYDGTGNLQTFVAQTLGNGEVFGEMGIIDDAPRSASAVAVKNTTCVAYTADEIMDMLETNPKEAMAYIHTLIRRLRSSNVKILVEGDGKSPTRKELSGFSKL